MSAAEFYGNEPTCHRGGRWCMTPWIQSIYICDSSSFPPLFCFKFQFQISSDQPFISFKDGLSYTSSSDSFLPDVALGYLFTSRQLPPALLKGWAMTHESPYIEEIKAITTIFFLSASKTPHQFNVHRHIWFCRTREAKGLFHPTDIINLSYFEECERHGIIRHLCQGEMAFLELDERRYQSFLFCYCPLLHHEHSNIQALDICYCSHSTTKCWLKGIVHPKKKMYRCSLTYNENEWWPLEWNSFLWSFTAAASHPVSLFQFIEESHLS